VKCGENVPQEDFPVPMSCLGEGLERPDVAIVKNFQRVYMAASQGKIAAPRPP
jgi:hypothetical protein